MGRSKAVVRVGVRALLVAVLFLTAYYLGRPLYWKLSATLQELRGKQPQQQHGMSAFAGLHRAQVAIGVNAKEDALKKEAAAVKVKKILGSDMVELEPISRKLAKFEKSGRQR